jgi:hypothetical protein
MTIFDRAFIPWWFFTMGFVCGILFLRIVVDCKV